MHTIKELNSRWYWRFLKVLYSLGFISILGISAILYYDIFQVYNDEPLYQVMKERIIKDYGDYQNHEKEIIEPIQQARQKSQAISEINTFFSDAGITLDDIRALAEEGIDFNEVVDKFTRNGIKVEGMGEVKIVELYKLSEKGYSYELLSEYNKYYNEYNTLSRNYRGISEYLKIIGSIFLTLLGLIVLTFILKRILYYIILGEPFPKE